MNVLRRLDAYFGTRDRFEQLLCGCVFALLVGCLAGIVLLLSGCNYGEGAIWGPGRGRPPMMWSVP